MTRFLWLVFTNPAEGAEQEYNHWYDEEHLQDILGVDGVLSAQRLEFAASAGADTPQHKYLAIYEVEADSPADVMAAMDKARAERGRMHGTTALDPDHRQWYFRPLGPPRVSLTADRSETRAGG